MFYQTVYVAVVLCYTTGYSGISCAAFIMKESGVTHDRAIIAGEQRRHITHVTSVSANALYRQNSTSVSSEAVLTVTQEFCEKLVRTSWGCSHNDTGMMLKMSYGSQPSTDMSL